MKSSTSIIIIPARLSSNRLSNKPLIKIGTIPMIIRVYNQALKANIGKVFVAGCDDRLAKLIKSYNFNYIHTEKNLISGTDRVYNAYTTLNQKVDNIINLQSDMPFIDPNTLRKIDNVLSSKDNQHYDIVTAVTSIEDHLIQNINTVKVIKNNQDMALYFTRNAIKLSKNFKHIGVYGFKVEALAKFASLPLSTLEKDEGLEQLRALDNGMKIKITIANDPNFSINTKQDLIESIQYVKEYKERLHNKS